MGRDDCSEAASDAGSDTIRHTEIEEQLHLQARILESVRESVVATDLEGRVLYWSRGAERLYGYRAEEVAGKRITFIVTPEEEAEEETRMAHVLEHGSWSGSYWQRRRDGSRFRADTFISLVRDRHGEPTGFVGIDRDITEQVRLSSQLALANRCLQAAMHHTQLQPMLEEYIAIFREQSGCEAVAIRLLDQAGNIPYEAYAGFPKHFYERESPLSLRSDRCMCISVIKNQSDAALPYFTPGGSFYSNATSELLASTSEEERGKTRNVCNEYGYESVALVPLRLDGEILGLIHIADQRPRRVPADLVTALEGAARQLAGAIRRVRSEEALQRTHDELERKVQERTVELQEANALYRAISEASPDGIFVIDADSTIRHASPGLAQLLGYAGPEQLEGVHGLSLLALEERERAVQNIGIALTLGQVRAEYRVLHRDGCEIPVDMNAARIAEADTDPPRIVGIVRDISERNAAQERLERSSKLLAAIRAAQARFIAGTDTPEIWPQLLDVFVSLTGSEFGFLDEVLTEEDGTRFKRPLAISDISWDDASRALYQELVSRNMEFRNLQTLAAAPAVSGEVVIANSARDDPRSGGLPPGHPPIDCFLGLPLLLGGELLGVAGVANRPGGYDQDAAAFLEPFCTTCALLVQAQRERQRQQETLAALTTSEHELAESLIQRETLLREVHHRVKNNLQVICSMIRLKMRELGDDPGRAVLQECEQRVRAMALIHEHLLRSDRPGRIDLKRYLERLARDLGLVYHRKTGEVRINVEAEPFDIDFERAVPLGLALNELVANALIHAFPVCNGASPGGHGELRIAAHATSTGLHLSVTDNGVGLPEGLDWRRTGSVGLALVSDLVEGQLGGSITLSREGGTRFDLQLPVRMMVVAGEGGS